MSRLFLLPAAMPRDPAIDAWFDARRSPLGALARRWFETLRSSGPDLRETLHDGCPVACIGDAALAYVNVFTAHVNLGFYQGALLDDPEGLLQGSGKLMRHVKLRPEREGSDAALERLLEDACADLRRRLARP